MMIVKLRKGTFQHIENELMDYHETKKEIVRLKNDILHASAPPDYTGGGRGNWPGDPTGRIATMLVSHRKIEHMEKVVNAIESVMERLPEDKKKLVQLYYWSKPRNLTWDGIALKLNVSRRTAINWRDEIVYAIAEKIGWS